MVPINRENPSMNPVPRKRSTQHSHPATPESLRVPVRLSGQEVGGPT